MLLLSYRTVTVDNRATRSAKNDSSERSDQKDLLFQKLPRKVDSGTGSSWRTLTQLYCRLNVAVVINTLRITQWLNLALRMYCVYVHTHIYCLAYVLVGVIYRMDGVPTAAHGSGVTSQSFYVGSLQPAPN